MFFADDLILFSEASLEQVEVVNNALNLFCMNSGQKINADKTRVFFSKNVNHIRANQICSELGFQVTTDLGKYLGAPIHHGRVSRITYNFIIEKVQRRLSSWKTSTLNLTGRAVLVNFVLHSIPSYSMQTASLPACVNKDVEKASRNFLWGSTNEKRKMHLISWERVCSPKVNGGLGVRNLRRNNDAHMMKLAWELTKNNEKLWVQVLRDKYKCGSGALPLVTPKHNSSNVWRGILHIWESFLKGTIWRVGDGRSVRFWQDSWVDGHPSLECEINMSLCQSLRDSRACDMVMTDGNWNSNVINEVLPSALANQVLLHSPPCDDAGCDIVAWNHSPNGVLTVKSAYESMSPNFVHSSDVIWKKLWKWDGVPKIRSFLWMMLHNRLVTRSLLVDRRIINSNLCIFYCGVAEDLIHCLRDYQRAKGVWDWFVKDSLAGQFFEMPVEDWILSNIQGNWGKDDLNAFPMVHYFWICNLESVEKPMCCLSWLYDFGYIWFDLSLLV